MVAIGIGLHNLGEGLAIGSAYASGALALGAFLVVGFAIHNTTEGLAIVAPLGGARPGFGRLAGLGLIAGAPAIVGAWIGAAAYNPSLAALLFGVGVGAIAQVVVQLVPSIRDERRRVAQPAVRARPARRDRRPLRDRAAGERLMGHARDQAGGADDRGDRGLREDDLRARQPRAGPGGDLGARRRASASRRGR